MPAVAFVPLLPSLTPFTLHPSLLPLQSGTNWIAAEVHRCQWCSDIFFDLEIILHVIQPCGAFQQSSIGRSILDSGGYTAAGAAGWQSGSGLLNPPSPSPLPLGMRSSSNLFGRVKKWTTKTVLATGATPPPPLSPPPRSPSPPPRPPSPPPSSSPPTPVGGATTNTGTPSECVRYPPMDKTFILVSNGRSLQSLRAQLGGEATCERCMSCRCSKCARLHLSKGGCELSHSLTVPAPSSLRDFPIVRSV